MSQPSVHIDQEYSAKETRNKALATLAAFATAHGANTLYADALYDGWTAQPKSLVNFAKLKKAITNSGVVIHTGTDVGPLFDPTTKTIKIPGKYIDPGILAHEWGHALSDDAFKRVLGTKLAKGWGSLYSLGTKISPITSLVPAAAYLADVDDKTLATIGAAGAALHAPQVLEELMASARGAAKLKKLNLPGKLKAFSGVPTYLSAAALPFLPLGLSKAEPLAKDLYNQLQ